MKHVYKKIATLTMAMVLGLSLVACGGEKDEKVTKKEKTDYTLSEYLARGDMQIWYDSYDGISKDAGYSAYIFKDGKCAHIDAGITRISKYPTIGDVAQATDEEIYNAYLEAYKEYVEQEKQNKEEIIKEHGNSIGYQDVQDEYDKISNIDTSDFPYYKYVLLIETDETGNVTQNEIVACYEDYCLSVGGGAEKYVNKIYVITSRQGQIYDSMYAGLKHEDSTVFYTRVDNDQITIRLDQPDAEGVIVDDYDEMEDKIYELNGVERD